MDDEMTATYRNTERLRGKVSDCCQTYYVEAEVVVGAVRHATWDRPAEGGDVEVVSVEVLRATTMLFGAEHEIQRPAAGWSQGLKDYCARELETDSVFCDRARGTVNS